MTDLRVSEEDGDDEGVFDRDALEAAERAVRNERQDEESWPATAEQGAHIDEPLVAVASAADGDLNRSLEPVYAVLLEAGIPAGFDPYRPGEASSPYGLRPPTVSVMVPQSFERRARDILREAEVVLPGRTVQPNAPLRTDVNQGSQSKRADLARSEDRAPEGRESRLVWRIVVIVLAVLIALAVLMAGLIVGPFLGR